MEASAPVRSWREGSAFFLAGAARAMQGGEGAVRSGGRMGLANGIVAPNQQMRFQTTRAWLGYVFNIPDQGRMALVNWGRELAALSDDTQDPLSREGQKLPRGAGMYV
jgi:hypothetical protein